jgi:hypothetical protein
MSTASVSVKPVIGLLAIACFWFPSGLLAQELVPGKITEILFPKADLPPTLYTMMTGTEVPPCLTVRLPDDFDPNKTYPLLVYVPGLHGGPKGNIYNAQTIAGPRGWIVATLPLFKKSIDPNEPVGGIIVSFQDYPVISKAYEIMLGRLFELVPNIDREKSAMVGFSNGAITIGVLVSCHDEFILTHFRNFCLVDHGMFHLTDLHKKYARGCRYLILVGDKEDLGRDLKIRRSQLLQDEMKLLGVNLSYQIMKDTGHEFQDRHMALVGKWLRNEAVIESSAQENASALKGNNENGKGNENTH